MTFSLNERYPKDPVDGAVEEMAELTKELMKANRFGLYDEWNGELNINRIKAEMEDVREALDNLDEWLESDEHATFNQT